MSADSDVPGNRNRQHGNPESDQAGLRPSELDSDGSASDSSVEAWWDTYKREADMSTLVDDTMDLAPVIHAGRDLHRAARLGDVEAIDELVRLAGVDPNTQDFFNATPLYLAAYCGHRAAVVKLLSLGARCDPGTFDGERAVYGALTDDIARVLRHAAAVVRQRGPLYADLARLWQAAVRARAPSTATKAAVDEVPGISGGDDLAGPADDGLGPDCALVCAGLPTAPSARHASEASYDARPDAGEVPVHACVAAAGSPVIRRLAAAAFSSTGRHPKRIVLPSPGAGDVGAEALGAVAEFLYTDRVTLPRRLLAQGISAAEGLGLGKLADKLREQQGGTHDDADVEDTPACGQAADGRKAGKGRKAKGRARALRSGFALSVKGSMFVTVDLSPASYVIGSIADDDGLAAAGGDTTSALGPERGVKKKNGVPWFKSVPSATSRAEAEVVLQAARRRQHRAEQRARRKMASALGGAAVAATSSEEDGEASARPERGGIDQAVRVAQLATAASAASSAEGPDAISDRDAQAVEGTTGSMVARGPAARFLAWRFSESTRWLASGALSSPNGGSTIGAAGSREVQRPGSASPSQAQPVTQARSERAPAALRMSTKPLRRRLCDVARGNIPPSLWKRRHARHGAVPASGESDRPATNHLPPDVVLEAAGVGFGAHRKLLMVRSAYFRTMLCSSFAEGDATVDGAAIQAAASGAGGRQPAAIEVPTVELAEMSPAVVAAMLAFTYTDELLKVGAAEALPELLLASDLFDMKDLRAATVQEAVKRLSWLNLAALFRIAESLNNVKLAGACSRFVALGLDEAVGRQDFTELVVESAMAIQSRDTVDSIPIVDSVRTEIQLVFGNPVALLPGVAPLLHASPTRGGGAAWVETGKKVFQPLNLSADAAAETDDETKSQTATFEGLPGFDYSSASFSKSNFKVPSDGPESVRRLGLLAELLEWLGLPSNLGSAFRA